MLNGLPDGALHLPNDTDLTFASVGGSDDVRELLRTAGGLPDATARAVAVATSLDLMRKGELSAADMLDCVLGVLAVEKNPALIEPFIAQARDAAEMWTPADQVDAARTRVADLALTLSREEELRRPALQVLAACATTTEYGVIPTQWVLEIRRRGGAWEIARVTWISIGGEPVSPSTGR